MRTWDVSEHRAQFDKLLDTQDGQGRTLRQGLVGADMHSVYVGWVLSQVQQPLIAPMDDWEAILEKPVDPELLELAQQVIHSQERFNMLPKEVQRQQTHAAAHAMFSNIDEKRETQMIADSAPLIAEHDDEFILHHELLTPDGYLDNLCAVLRERKVMPELSEAIIEVDEGPAPTVELAVEYDTVLRNLCLYLSVGGYNSDGMIKPETADAKIRWGIEDIRSSSYRDAYANIARAAERAKTWPLGENADDGWIFNYAWLCEVQDAVFKQGHLLPVQGIHDVLMELVRQAQEQPDPASLPAKEN